MTRSKVKVTHLFHSGFMLETEHHVLIFDYFEGDDCLKLTHEDFKNIENVFVFSTHSHRDHFDKKILDWNASNINIHYVLSDDITLKYPEPNHHFMKPYEHKLIDKLNIITYGSTDLGLSFLVEVDGFSIFHAGDLNWWHWKKDSQEGQEKEEKDYKTEVDRLKGKEIDIAFIPVDPRLDEYYYLAGEYFAKTINPKVIVPMHFSNHYGIVKAFHDKISTPHVFVPIITEDNRSFVYEK